MRFIFLFVLFNLYFGTAFCQSLSWSMTSVPVDQSSQVYASGYAIDKAGSVYFIAGQQGNSLLSGNYLTTSTQQLVIEKIDKRRKLAWQEVIMGDAYVFPSSIAVDDSGNVYVSALITAGNTALQIGGKTYSLTRTKRYALLVKYSSLGKPRNVRMFEIYNGYYDHLKIDENQNIYWVIGYDGYINLGDTILNSRFRDKQGNFLRYYQQHVIIKMNSDFSGKQFLDVFEGGAEGGIHFLVFDPQQKNLYLFGDYKDSVKIGGKWLRDTLHDFLNITKISTSNGRLLWTKDYTAYIIVGGADVDSSGNLYFSNSGTWPIKFDSITLSVGNDIPFNYFVKLDSSGKVIYGRIAARKTRPVIYENSGGDIKVIGDKIYWTGGYLDSTYVGDTMLRIPANNLSGTGYLFEFTTSGDFVKASTYNSRRGVDPEIILPEKNGFIVAGVYQKEIIINNRDTIAEQSYDNGGDIFALEYTYACPQVSFTADNSCLKDVLVLENKTTIASGNISSWQWNFGDGTVDSSRNPTHVFTDTGTYTITLKAVSLHGCTDSFSQRVKVYARPAYALHDTDICLGNNLEFGKRPSSIKLWTWNFGDNNETTDSLPMHRYTRPGTYTLFLKATGEGGCTDSFSTNIHVHSLPDAGFLLKDSGSIVHLAAKDTAGGNSYLWTFGNGDSATGKNTEYTYTKDSTYIINLSVTSKFGCVEYSSDTIKIKTSIYQPTENLKVAVYPNPFKNQLYIRCADENCSRRYNITIIDLQGRNCIEKVNSTGGDYLLNTSLLPAGAYLLRILEGNSSFESVIVKQ
jgi:PKD repeat protein